MKSSLDRNQDLLLAGSKPHDVPLTKVIILLTYFDMKLRDVTFHLE